MNELGGECPAWEDDIRPAKYCSVEQGNNCPNSKGSPTNIFPVTWMWNAVPMRTLQ